MMRLFLGYVNSFAVLNKSKSFTLRIIAVFYIHNSLFSFLHFNTLLQLYFATVHFTAVYSNYATACAIQLSQHET